MSLFSVLEFGRWGSTRNRPQRRRPIRNRQRAPVRPTVQPLEDRCLPSFTLGPLVQVAPVDLFAGAKTFTQGGDYFPNTQVEPRVAVDPTNLNHIVGVWQQDRWDNGGSFGTGAGVSFDAGQHWQEVVIPGLTTASGGSFNRASDPWISFGPTGKVYESSLVINVDSKGVEQESGIAVNMSSDGGLTWSAPTILILTNFSGPNFIENDKESITADPQNPNLVYTIWDQVSTNGTSPGQTFLSRSTDGGQTWSSPQLIFDSPG